MTATAIAGPRAVVRFRPSFFFWMPLAMGLFVFGGMALTTGSRDVAPEEARIRLCEAGAIVRRLAPRVIFKKIDSTLRGNSGFEIVGRPQRSTQASEGRYHFASPGYFESVGIPLVSGRFFLPTDDSQSKSCDE